VARTKSQGRHVSIEAIVGAALRAEPERYLHDRLRVSVECEGVENASINNCSDVYPCEQLSVVARVHGGWVRGDRAHGERRGPGPKVMAI
jgi:hypothetical protein